MLQQPTKEYENKLLAIIQEYPLFTITTLGYLSPDDIRDELIRKVWKGATTKIGKDTDDYDASNIVSDLLIETRILEQGHRYTSSLNDITPDACVKKIQEMAYFRRVDELNAQIASAVRIEDGDKVTSLTEQLREPVQPPTLFGRM